MRLKARFVKRTPILLGVLVAIVLTATVAYAASASFPDVPPTYWAHDSIIKLADQGIIKGHDNGTFGPDESITRAQAAVMLDRTEQVIAGKVTAPLAAINRGCPACHPTEVGNPAAPPFTPGRPDPSRGNAPTFSLKWEAMGGTATSTRFLLHTTLSDTATITTCLGCHAAGTGEQTGNSAPISLRTIVHPAHLNSGIFVGEFRGNCFTCHEITNSGKYDILTQKVDVNAQGIPDDIPTPGLLEPSRS
jgi:S-layer homology domain